MLLLHWNANLLLRSEATVDLHWLLQSQFNSSDNQSLTAQELKMMHLKLKTEFFASPVAAVKVSEISIVLELIWCVTLTSKFHRVKKAKLVFGKRYKNGVFQIRLNIERENVLWWVRN